MMDDHNSLKQPPHPKEELTDEGIVQLHHYSNPLDKGRATSS